MYVIFPISVSAHLISCATVSEVVFSSFTADATVSAPSKLFLVVFGVLLLSKLTPTLERFDEAINLSLPGFAVKPLNVENLVALLLERRSDSDVSYLSSHSGIYRVEVITGCCLSSSSQVPNTTSPP